MSAYDDFEFDIDNLVLRHISGSSVYPVNTIYKVSADLSDDQGRMIKKYPMVALTPVDYRMVYGWFITPDAVKYLSTGSITTSGYTHPTNPTGIRLLTFTAPTSCVSGDVGKPVLGGTTGDAGTLLYYDNAAGMWWIRCIATDDLFDVSETVSVTGGTGTGTTAGASATGEDVYTGVYTIGTIEAGSSIYLRQNEVEISPWWSTGNIDILIYVQRAGALISSGLVDGWIREWGDSGKYFEADLSSGARTPVSVFTRPDLSNASLLATVGAWDDVLFAFVNGTINYGSGTGSGLDDYKILWDQTSNATGVILKKGTTVSGTFTLGNVEGSFASSHVVSLLAQISFGTQTTAFTAGQVVTQAVSGATGTIRRVDQDPNGLGVTGRLYLSNVSGTFNAVNALSDPLGGAATATSLLTAAPSWQASTTGAFAVAHTMLYNLENGAGEVPWDVVIKCQSRALAQCYERSKYIVRKDSTHQLRRVVSGAITPISGRFYNAAYTGYEITEQAPFGQMPGTTFFGARGVLILGMVDADINNAQLVDSTGATQFLPNRQNLRITGLIVGDRVALFKLTGAGGDPDENMMGGVDTTSAGVSYLNLVGPIPADTPASGTIWVKKSGEKTSQYVMYSYSGISGNQLTGLSPVTAKAYAVGDTCLIPYIDEVSAASSVSVQIIQIATRPCLVEVRKYGYNHFEIESEITALGLLVQAIRTVDTAV
jgi:hypothetical protein